MSKRSAVSVDETVDEKVGASTTFATVSSGSVTRNFTSSSNWVSSGCDFAVVHLDESFHQGEADSESAIVPFKTMLA